MSAEDKQSPFVEIGEHKVFYTFGQQSLSIGTSYAEEWDKNYFVISTNSWVKDDNGQPKQLKRGVYLTLPAARALVGVLKASVEEAEAFELRSVLLKRHAQPKKPVASDGHIAAYLKQCEVRSAASAGGPTTDALGPSAERAWFSSGGTGVDHKFVGHSITAAASNLQSSSASSAAAFTGIADGDGGAKHSKPRVPRKQQQKPETAGAASARAGRPRKVLKADDDIDERDAGDAEDDGNDSYTRM